MYSTFAWNVQNCVGFCSENWGKIRNLESTTKKMSPEIFLDEIQIFCEKLEKFSVTLK